MGGIEGDQSGNLLVGLKFLTSSSKKISSFRINSYLLGNFSVTNSAYWSPDMWHSIEFRFKRGTSDGGIQCWIDNDLVVDEMDKTYTEFANTFSVGPWTEWGYGFGNGKYVYIDDVVASVSPAGELIAPVGLNGFSSNIKGLTLYYLPDGEGYLMASSQGNNRFYVFNRKAPYDYIKYFTVSGVTTAEGIDV